MASTYLGLVQEARDQIQAKSRVKNPCVEDPLQECHPDGPTCDGCPRLAMLGGSNATGLDGRTPGFVVGFTDRPRKR